MMITYTYLSLKRFLTLTSLLLLLLVGNSQIPPQVLAQRPQITAFVNVHVIPLDTERMLEHQTVIVEDDRITAIGPVDALAVPDGAQVIAGNDAYLMPGLADMHVHLSHDADPDHMRLYLAQGVTTVRNLNALPEHLKWREKVARGEWLGPTIYTSGPSLNGVPPEANWIAGLIRLAILLLVLLFGVIVFMLFRTVLKLAGQTAAVKQMRRYVLPGFSALVVVGGLVVWFKVIPIGVFAPYIAPTVVVVETPAEARRAIIQQKDAGYDLIKPYEFLSEAAYIAAMAEARIQNMYTVGHLVDEIPLAVILTSGQQEVAHIDEYVSYHSIGYDPSAQDFIAYDINYEAIPQSVALTKENNVTVVSNLVIGEVLSQLAEDSAGLLSKFEYRVVRPEVLQSWKNSERAVNRQDKQDYRRNVVQPFLFALIKALHDAEVHLLIGTDVIMEGMLPYHIHRELELLVEAGLTPFDALAAGTKNAGLSVDKMGRDGSFGTVAEGQRADLLLLEQNPLESVSHTRNRIGVMVRGQWLTQDELDGLVDTFVATYQADASAVVAK